MNAKRLRSRLARRTLHRSRSVAVSLTLVMCILVVAYAGVECVLEALGRPALWVSPKDAVAAFAEPGTIGLIAGAVAAVLGIVLIVVAVAPAHLSRHRLADDRMVVIVENGVIAGALKHAALRASHVPEQRARATVGRRVGIVRITPSSGLPVNAPALEGAVTTLLESLEPTPRMRASVTVTDEGVVGS